jgi:diaminopimelate decarboxylase
VALNDVLPATWTEHDGVASVGGVPLSAIAERYGTPAYVFDVAHLEQRLSDIETAMRGIGTPVYATKAFLCTAFAEMIAGTTWWADVVSLGEAENVMRGGIPADRILLHGNLKTDAELDLAVTQQVSLTVIDSLDELTRLDAAARAASTVIDVMIRLNEDVDLATHPKILTSGDKAKFGLLPDEAADAVERISQSNNVRMRGVHLHVGSQATDPGLYGVVLARLIEFVARHRNAFQTTPVVLDVGGGMAAPYLRDDPTVAFADVVASLRATLANHPLADAVGPVEVLVEPGRYLTANSAVLLYTVGVRKPLPAGGELVALDGGMTDNPRPALYGSQYELLPVTPHDSASSSVRVFGRMCESDVLLSAVEVPDSLGPGDVVAMPAAGAYTFSMSSRYNGLRRPPVLFVKDGEVREVVRRETIEDLLAAEYRLVDAEGWSYTPGS